MQRDPGPEFCLVQSQWVQAIWAYIKVLDYGQGKGFSLTALLAYIRGPGSIGVPWLCFFTLIVRVLGSFVVAVTPSFHICLGSHLAKR